MPFEYYCTNCGKKLSQDTVLFDMQYVLTKQKDKKFNILKFRLTQTELKALYEAALPVEDSFKEIDLSFGQFLAYAGNQNNLNDPVIAQLSMDQIRSYLGEDSLSASVAAAEDLPPVSNDPFADEEEETGGFAALGDAFKSLSKKKKKKKDQEQEAQSRRIEDLPPPIQAIYRKDTSNMDISFTDGKVTEDFKTLKLMFANGEVCKIRLRLITEKDSDGADVLTGYQVYPSLFIDETAEPRLCSKCDYPVFRHAGTAKHHNIAFFGTRRSGKTSLILAITHYIVNGIQVALDPNSVWKDAERISEIKTIELLNHKPGKEQNETEAKAVRNRTLYDDLRNYPLGIAPSKTDAQKRENAYNATFRIQDTLGKYHLLTLTDLPGELIDEETGIVDKSILAERFPTALACDAYVLCFDTYTEGQGKGLPIQATLNAANTIQNMHAIEHHKKNHVPVIIVYTKCEALEAMEILENPGIGNVKNQEKRAHMFCGECERISSTQAYDFVSTQFENYEHLKDVYKTRLRCSAFGYQAPSEDDLKNDPSIPTQKPTPKYVEHLVRWLFSISGCIPVKGGYQAVINGPVWEEAENYVSRVQYRGEAPLQNDALRESLARVILFENPSGLDVEYVQSHGEGAKLLKTKAKAFVKSIWPFKA